MRRVDVRIRRKRWRTAAVPLSMSPASVAAASALLPGAQHVGGADIAGADAADVGRAGEPRQQDAERDRAAQIAEHQGRGSASGRERSWCDVRDLAGAAAFLHASRGANPAATASASSRWMTRCLSLSAGARAQCGANPEKRSFARYRRRQNGAPHPRRRPSRNRRNAACRCCEAVFLDDIELVGGILPFGGIAGDAIGIVALQAGADRLHVDRMVGFGEAAAEQIQRFVLLQMQQQRDQRHADRNAVGGLLKIDGAAIGIE